MLRVLFVFLLVGCLSQGCGAFSAAPNAAFFNRHGLRRGFSSLAQDRGQFVQKASGAGHRAIEKISQKRLRRNSPGVSVAPRMDLNFANVLFQLNSYASQVVGAQLQNLTPVSALVIFGAGVITSLSPCSLSVLPLTVGYIGGGSGGKDAAVLRSVAFTAGLAGSLSVLGCSAALAGQVYGVLPEPWGSSLPLLTSALFVVLGLTQLEILPLPALISPTVSDKVGQNMGDIGRAALFGATSALISSPCGTPVIGALLAVVAQRQDPLLGLALLFFYSLGSAAPLLVAGLSTAALKDINKLQPTIAWVTPASGSLLMVYGTYSALERIFP